MLAYVEEKGDAKLLLEDANLGVIYRIKGTDLVFIRATASTYVLFRPDGTEKGVEICYLNDTDFETINKEIEPLPYDAKFVLCNTRDY